MTDELATRLRAALEPTRDDHARADPLVDDVLAAGDARRDEPHRRAWLLPAAAAAAALALATGVALPGALSPHDAGSPSAPAGGGERRHDGTEYVDAQTWQESEYPRMKPFSTSLAGSPLVAVRSAPWCPACGGEDFLAPILASATAQRHVRFVVVVPRVPAGDVARWGEAAPPNVRIVAGRKDALLPGERRADSASTPALVRLSRLGAVIVSAHGRDEVAAALAPPPPPQVVTVRCRDGKVDVDHGTVDAAPDGVHVRVVNESGSEVDPRFGPGTLDRPSEPHRRVPAGKAEEWIEALPPGETTVTCVGDQRSTAVPDGQQVRPAPGASLTVQDPHGYWRGTATDAGCPMGGMPGWAGVPGHGRTPPQAAATWPRDLPDGEPPAAQRAGYAVRAVRIGYVEARNQFFVVENHGRPETLLRTYRTDDGGGIEAAGEWICRGAL